jgi:hypothetical protein
MPHNKPTIGARRPQASYCLLITMPFIERIGKYALIESSRNDECIVRFGRYIFTKLCRKINPSFIIDRMYVAALKGGHGEPVCLSLFIAHDVDNRGASPTMSFRIAKQIPDMNTYYPHFPTITHRMH